MIRYYAFVSYNHNDEKVAQWLHRNLESFRLPSEIHNEIKAEQRFIRPVFRDKDELNAGILENELRDKLESSKYLIVICSRNSAQSEWVNNEVRTFIEMGRLAHIIPLIIEDGPDVFPKSLREYAAVHPDRELLGVSIPEVGKEKALIRVISKMLDVSFDSLWNRHKRRQRRNRLLIVLGALAVVLSIGIVWFANQPKDVKIVVNEGGYINSDLPSIRDIIVSLDLGSEIKIDTLNNIGNSIDFTNIPARIAKKPIRISVCANHCSPGDTVVTLSNMNAIRIYRDVSAYGHVWGRLYDFEKEQFLAGRHLLIAGVEVITDHSGSFEVDIPIESQKESYFIDSPDTHFINNVIYMPCKHEAIIEAK